jgi:hypothetical protein
MSRRPPYQTEQTSLPLASTLLLSIPEQARLEATRALAAMLLSASQQAVARPTSEAPDEAR